MLYVIIYAIVAIVGYIICAAVSGYRDDDDGVVASMFWFFWPAFLAAAIVMAPYWLGLLVRWNQNRVRVAKSVNASDLKSDTSVGSSPTTDTNTC